MLSSVDYDDVLTERTSGGHVIVSAWYIVFAIAVFVIASA
jgi:hypothetical protein